MKLRGHDHVGMKDFIHSVQQRVNELKASSGNGQANMSGKRMEFMLETICDIKNNKKRPKEETVQHTRIKKWLQKYCLWDHYKELETMPLMRSMHLSKFTAEMVASFSVSLAILKVVDLSDPVQLTPKRIMHFRMLFEAIFDFPDKLIWNAFSRIAAAPEYESLRTGIKFFISKYVISSSKSLEQKFKIAKQAIKNVKGQLL